MHVFGLVLRCGAGFSNDGISLESREIVENRH